MIIYAYIRGIDSCFHVIITNGYVIDGTHDNIISFNIRIILIKDFYPYVYKKSFA